VIWIWLGIRRWTFCGCDKWLDSEIWGKGDIQTLCGCTRHLSAGFPPSCLWAHFVCHHLLMWSPASSCATACIARRSPPLSTVTCCHSQRVIYYENALFIVPWCLLLWQNLKAPFHQYFEPKCSSVWRSNIKLKFGGGGCSRVERAGHTIRSSDMKLVCLTPESHCITLLRVTTSYVPCLWPKH
jgi:hypothetical protein